MIYRMPLITTYGKFAPTRSPVPSGKITRFSAVGIGGNPSHIFFHGQPGIRPIVQNDAISEAAFAENAGGTAINDDSTFGGYTLGQITEAIRRAGILT